MLRLARLAAAALFLATSAFAAPGDLDPAFGTAGRARVSIGQSIDTIVKVIVQADGRTLALGNSNGNLSLVRYNVDGSPDATFGDGGKRLYPGRAVGLVQPMADGRMVGFGSPGNGSASGVVRLFADGTLDPSFDSAPSAALLQDRIGHGLAVQPDGAVLVVRSNDLRPYRLLADGTADVAFNTASHAGAAITGAPVGILVQADGAIVVAGTLQSDSGVSTGVTARRFTAAGALDSSFNAPTFTGDPDPYSTAQATSAALQPDGKILIGASSGISYSERVALMRLLPSGAADPTFGTNGYATPDPDTQFFSAVDMVVRPDGRIAIAAARHLGTPDPGMHVLQVGASGTLDPSFGNGHVTLVGDTHSRAISLALQADGRLIVGGAYWNRDFAVARLEANGTLDAGYASGGIAITGFLAGRAMDVKDVRRSGDKLVVLANLWDYSIWGEPAQGGVGVLRLMADGTPDPAFGIEGQAIGSLATNPQGGTYEEVVDALAVQADGKVLVGGFGVVNDAGAAVVMRFNADGSLDTGFGTGGRSVIRAVGYTNGVQALEVLPDGRILAGGPGFVARLLANGALDGSYGTAGIAELPVTSSNYGQPRVSLTPLADGRVIVTGFRAGEFAALRLTASGHPDPTFGTPGQLVFARPAYTLAASTRAAAIRPDGALAFVGTITRTETHCFPSTYIYAAFAFTDADGHASPSLPQGGLLPGPLGPLVIPSSLEYDAQGRGVAAGSKHVQCISGEFTGFLQSQRAPVVARFAPSGALDTTFGSGGLAMLPTPGSPYSVTALKALMLPDGNIAALTSDGSLFKLQGGGTVAPPAKSMADIDGDGMPNDIEVAEGRDPFVRDHDVFTNARYFAIQQYRDFLGREGDAAGVAHWAGQIDGGAQSRTQMIGTFFESAEFQGVMAPVARLYFAYFLRVPDYEGLAYWTAQAQALGLAGVSNAFATSPEFAGTYGALDNAQFVDRVYRNVLGRAPDSAGLAFWTGQLDGGMTRGEMMVQFSESAEYRVAIDSEVFVTMIYAGMMRRAPDPEGFAFWVGQRDFGSGSALIAAFLAAPEYRNRFLP